MSIQKKILDLRLNAALAERVAYTWQKLLDDHGEEKTVAFYQHLGLNHLEVEPLGPRPAGDKVWPYRCPFNFKQVEWEGLTLSRQPKDHEAPQVKAIASAQASAKERLSNLLLVIRNALVEDALGRIEKLSAPNYHKLIVTVSDIDHEQLRDAVTTTFNDGRLLIAAQRGIKQSNDDDF